MSIPFFVKGLILGFSIAAPVGPIGILCLRRTLQFGRLSGLCSGMGAAFADTIYAIVAAFGLTVISTVLVAGQFWLQLIGGAFLVYLGVKTFFARFIENEKEVTHRNLWNDFFSTFFLTAANPLTIVSFVAVFAGLGLTSGEGNYQEAFLLVVGVFLGSSTWWLLLSEGISFFRDRFNRNMMQVVNRVAGVFIALFGIAALATL